MNSPTARARDVASRALQHLLRRVAETPALTEPFGHVYLTDVLPPDVYWELLDHLPDPGLYAAAAERHYGDGVGNSVRWMFALTIAALDRLPGRQQALWRGVAAALSAPALKRAVYAKLAPDLAYRYAVPESAVPDLAGYSRPTLYRETDGFEIPPHPDTRKKIVTMHLYLPADLTQLGLGTALYRRRVLALPFGDWRRRFVRVKQFPFRPNSAYAFVVNNTLTKRSWHGRERLPEGAGVRNTLLNTFYAEPREGFSGYLPESPTVAPARNTA
ncbi:MAG TPA: hypothetical protein VKE74_22750 [Gemmataceae bacterium]|nr:hypothetical protein [Gemmataceae bacterium]